MIINLNKLYACLLKICSGLRMKKLELHQQFSLKALFFLLLSCIKALLVLHHLAKLLLKLLGLFLGKGMWLKVFSPSLNPANICLFKVNNRNTTKSYERCSKPTINPERLHWRRSDVFIVNLEHILHLFYFFYVWLWTSKC